MSDEPDTPKEGDGRGRRLTLNEVNAALADEDHPLHEVALRENAEITSDLSGTFLSMLDRVENAASEAAAVAGSAAMDAIRNMQVDLPQFNQPSLEHLANRSPFDLDYSLPDIEPYLDPTPAKLDEVIAVGRAQHEAMARILLAADMSAKAAERTAEDGKRYGRRSLIAAWAGIGVAVLIGAASIIVAVVLNR